MNTNYPPDKVYQCLLKTDEMLRVTGDLEDYWADFGYIEKNNLESLVPQFKLDALKNGECDYIAFRLKY